LRFPVWIWSRYGWLPVLLLLAGTACTRDSEESTPVKTLEQYVRTSFQATGIQDKRVMESLLTGDTRSRLEAWNDEQFQRAFVDQKKTFKELKILENRKVSPQEVILVYELSYHQGPQDKGVKITQRKLGTLVREQADWKIKEVRSIRESIEYLEELSLP
jgi:hypothetical protein